MYTNCPECGAPIRTLTRERLNGLPKRPSELLSVDPDKVEAEQGPLMVVCQRGHRTRVNPHTLVAGRSGGRMFFEFEWEE